MKPQLSPALHLRSALVLTIGLTAVIPAALQAQAPIAAPKPVKPLTLPTALSNQVLETMAGTLGGDRQQFIIGKITPATWQDCVPIPDRYITGDCAPQPRSGWRVQAQGKGETWQYFVTSGGGITLDGPASVSPKVRAGLAKSLNRDVKTLRFQAVQLAQNMEACPVGALCKMAANPAWKILLEDMPSPYTMTLQGKRAQDGSFASFLPPNLAGLPPSYGEAVLRDVRDRTDGMLTQNFRVEGIKAIKWNDCQGGGPVPSQPMRGICPDIHHEGWQMITISGPVRWVHYLMKPEGTTLPPLDRVTPDGPQSLPKSIGTTLMRSLAKREGKLLSNYRVHWTDATFFDGCLNPVVAMQLPNRINPAVGCRQRIQSGWQVSVIGNEISGGGQPLTTYHVNALGTDYRVISQTQWSPPPVAAPPRR